MKKTIILFLYLTSAFTAFSQESGENLLNLKNISFNDYKIQNLEIHPTSNGIELSVKSGEQGSISFFPANQYWDLTQWAFLSLELENLTTNQVRFDPALSYDNPRRGKKFQPVYNKHIGFLQPNENLIYNCLMIRDKITAPDYPQYKDFPQMKGLPEGVILNFAGIDAKHIKAFEIVFPKQDTDVKVLVKRVYKNRQGLPELYKENKEAFFPFINSSFAPSSSC